MRQTGPALEAHYRFILWLVPVLERFPPGSADVLVRIGLNAQENTPGGKCHERPCLILWRTILPRYDH